MTKLWLICAALGAVVAPSPAMAGSGISGPTSAHRIARLEARDLRGYGGGRYAAFQTSNNRVVIFDSLRTRQRTLRDCFLWGGVDDRFLMSCRRGQGFYLPRAHRIVAIKNAGVDTFRRMGRDWLLGSEPTDDPMALTWVYLNWRTGQQVECGFFVDPDCDDFSYDLDHKSLTFLDPNQVAADPPFALRLSDASQTTFKRRLTLRRSHARPRVLARGLYCSYTYECSAVVDGHVAGWVASPRPQLRPQPRAPSTRVVAYSIRRHRELVWKLHRAGGPGYVRALHTDYGVVTWYCTEGPQCSSSEGARWHVFFMKWPTLWKHR